jgi:catechol 2,3-dioxygenase-like lactoylglutathione lyase family enzyme
MSEEWYARPVLFVADIDRTLDFYVNQLGFTQSWRFEEDGQAVVAQADRQGCALIFSSQWPDKVGKGLMFISLTPDAPLEQINVAQAKALDRLRAELESKDVKVEDGYWGYRLLVVRDPDGNELYFNYAMLNVTAKRNERALPIEQVRPVARLRHISR